MKYLTRKYKIRNIKNSIKKSRKNKTRKFNGGVKTSSLILFPLALSSSFVMPNNNPSRVNRISTKFQKPLNKADGGGGIIPPNNFLTTISFQEDPDRSNKGNKYTEITDEEILKKLGVKKDHLEKLLKSEREGAKIRKKQLLLKKLKKKYESIHSL